MKRAGKRCRSALLHVEAEPRLELARDRHPRRPSSVTAMSSALDGRAPRGAQPDIRLGIQPPKAVPQRERGAGRAARSVATSRR